MDPSVPVSFDASVTTVKKRRPGINRNFSVKEPDHINPRDPMITVNSWAPVQK